MSDKQLFVSPNGNDIQQAGKAYDNTEFIHSRDGRTIRILSEYLYPEQYFRNHNVENAVVFFGSARTLSEEAFAAKMDLLKSKLDNAQSDQEKDTINNEINSLENIKFLSKVYSDGVELAKMIAEWSNTLPEEKRMFVCTGGGPGMMEAANKGAYLASSPNIGLNISLPFEQAPNGYISDALNFEFHYFFMRKFWFANLAIAMVALPGGFGTLDELFEILTLKQTTKISKPLPIVLYCSEFWKKLINFDYLVDVKMINKDDLKLFKFCDSPKEAFDWITSELTKLYDL